MPRLREADGALSNSNKKAAGRTMKCSRPAVVTARNRGEESRNMPATFNVLDPLALSRRTRGQG